MHGIPTKINIHFIRIQSILFLEARLIELIFSVYSYIIIKSLECQQKTIMIKNVYWKTNLYFLVITDDANRSWCMEIHVDQINCSQDQIVMQSSIQCRTFEFLKAVKKNTCTLQFLGKSCNAKHALLRHFICTLHQVNLFHKTFSVLLHVFQTFNRLGDRFLSCCEIFLPTYWNVFSSKSDTSEQSNNNQMVPDALGSRTPALGVKLLSITVMTRCEKQFWGCWQDL